MLQQISVIIILLLVCPEGKGQSGQVEGRYFLVPTVSQEPQAVISFPVKQDEGFYPDTLYQVISEEGYPISYYRKIMQEVCFDEKCRLLRVNLYWNLTGRYLGIELPRGEFLSKAEHEPFNQHEYHQLNALLADSLSPLAHYTYSDLVPQDKAAGLGVDAITSATSKSILGYVVPGAVYTTYTLWHLIYGETRNEIMRLTDKVLSPELMLKILTSPDRGDIYWVLERVKERPLSPPLRNKLLSLIQEADYSLALRTLAAIQPEHLLEDSLQLGLVNKFDSTGYSLKNLLIAKLGEAPRLNGSVALHLAGKLESLNGEPLIGIFNLFRKHRVADPEILLHVTGLLEKENAFIAKRAYEYLQYIDPDDPVIRQKMKRYISFK